MIAIKGMKMPSCCAKCRIGASSYCYAKSKPPYNLDHDIRFSRADDCPLIEIVTCEECEHWHDDGIMTTCDKKIGHGFPKDHFCPDGKKKEPRELDDTYVNGLPRDEEYFRQRITGNPDFCNG